MTGRSNESAFRHPDTVAPIRSMIESEAAIHPPTFRVCEGGIIRCRQAWCVKSGSRRCGVPAAESQSAGAGDAAQPALMSAQVTPAASRAMPGKTWPATLARTGLADRRKLPPTARAWPLPCTGEALPAGKWWVPWEDQPGSMSVANRLWARVFGESDHGGTNAAKVLLYQLRALAGRARSEHIDYGNEHEPRGRRLVNVLIFRNVDLDGDVGRLGEGRAGPWSG